MAYSSDSYQVAPSPNRTIGCQDLLKDGACVHSGWLRRQSIRNKFKIFSWPQVYVVISGGCVYCYSNETARKPASAFSLYGYDKVFRAGEITAREATWTFKIVHVNADYRSYLFSSSSEKELLFWMSLFKDEMLRANGKLPRTQGDGINFDAATYQKCGSDYSGSIQSQDYMDIETSIYEDSSQCILPKNYYNQKENDLSDEEMDKVVMTRPDLQERPPQAPPVPQRPGKLKPVGGVVNKGMVAVKNEMEQNLVNNPSHKKSWSNEQVSSRQEADKTSKELWKRGSPDGSSVKKNEQRDREDFWSSIYFYGGRERASEIIRSLADEGVFLVRVNEDRSMVLHVFAGNASRKFQIFHMGEKYTLKKETGDAFYSVPELVYYYYTNPLPNLDVCLSDCYVQHAGYHNLQLS